MKLCFKKYNQYKPIIILKFILDRVKNLPDILKAQVENTVKKNNKDEFTDMILEARIFNLFIFENNITEIKKLSQLKNKIIGIKIDKHYIYYENEKWYECDNIVIKKYENKQKKTEHNEIYGLIKKGNFKIIDLSKFKNAFTVNYKESKRSIITGRNCTTFPMKYLNSILTKLKIPVTKLKKNDICILIELKLRELEFQSNKLKYFNE